MYIFCVITKLYFGSFEVVRSFWKLLGDVNMFRFTSQFPFRCELPIPHLVEGFAEIFIFPPGPYFDNCASNYRACAGAVAVRKAA